MSHPAGPQQNPALRPPSATSASIAGSLAVIAGGYAALLAFGGAKLILDRYTTGLDEYATLALPATILIAALLPATGHWIQAGGRPAHPRHYPYN